VRLAYAFALFVLAVAPPSKDDHVIGIWRGDSLCVSRLSACVDEKVIYYISATATSTRVSIRADKIVGGKAITMGTGEWQYDADHHTLTWETPRQTWLLTVGDGSIEGTLSLADKTVVRRMTLKREHGSS
jgi:hypothetical protein